MRVVVTGGAGFIGSHLTDALLERGDEVWVVDDLSTGCVDRLSDRAVFVRQSITEVRPLSALIGSVRPELIFHLAAQISVRASVKAPADDAFTNVVGTINVLEAASKAGARVIFCSSGGALYGSDAPVPTPEHAPIAPESPYGVSKYACEQYVYLYNRLHGARHCVLRLANVYGPRQNYLGDAAVIPLFCAMALRGEPPLIFGDGTQTRDYLYVSDAVDAFLAAADSESAATVNVGTGIEVSVFDLAELVGAISGQRLPPRFAASRRGEIARSAVLADGARQALGWEATTCLADGVRNVYWWIEAGAHNRCVDPAAAH